MFNFRLNLDTIKGVVFDCYDTLIEISTDEESIATYELVSTWLLYQGVRISPDRLHKTYRQMVQESLNRSRERYPEIRIEKIFSDICRDYRLWEIDEQQLGVQVARLFRAASLRRLRSIRQSERLLEVFSGLPKGLVSNGQRVFSEMELRALSLLDHFDAVIFSSDEGCKKPSPRIFQSALKQLGLSPGEVLVIGDSFENDIIPALKLGMQALFVEDALEVFRDPEVTCVPSAPAAYAGAPAMQRGAGCLLPQAMPMRSLMPAPCGRPRPRRDTSLPAGSSSGSPARST
ncbi:MAG: HAD family hydrolase [Methanomicrobiaceae archaeon]|nr:HAD family hydrolase [Methanomicrobiaceae archaeon]